MLTEERIDCAILDLRNECAHYMTELGCGEKEQCEKCYIPTALEALEKQIPKAPKLVYESLLYSYSSEEDWAYECPCCGSYDIDYFQHHCTCGQKLDWGLSE